MGEAVALLSLGFVVGLLAFPTIAVVLSGPPGGYSAKSTTTRPTKPRPRQPPPGRPRKPPPLATVVPLDSDTSRPEARRGCGSPSARDATPTTA